ncbi:MAG TPA: DHA2 family efflux MFS transporter permease subunit [Thermoanaerobaculia bacterium]|jgi:DHA2 family multidrug resistance protein|nr:DHA2 family efflux MFS transporter permease subunit [Thermoanaerobaculia bacterium]
MSETGANKWIITVTVILASMIELIDTSIVNVALPQMMGNLGATLDQIAWVVTGYVVANVIVIPMTGWLASVFGRRNYFTFSLILFTVTSFFCGHATSLWELVIFRFLQGAAGGAMLSTSQAILVETFPPEELGMANGLFGLGVVVGPTVGPTLGGWITDSYSWRWIFYVNLPIGIIAALMAMAFIPDPHERRRNATVDWLGIGLLVVGIGSLQIVLERGESEDWFAATYITVLTFVAVLGIAAFIWRELSTSNPVVDLHVLRDRSLALGTVFTFILGFGLYASVFILPVFAQNLLGFTAMQTGLILLPGSLATAVMMPLVGRLLQRGVPPQLMNALGFVCFFFFTLMMSHSTLASGRGDFFWPLILRGLGLGLLFVPLTTLALSNLRGKDIPQGAGLTNMMRQLGGSFGVALVATFIQHRAWTHRVNLLSHVSIYDEAVRQRLAAITQGLMARGSTLYQAQQQAYGAIEGTVVKQTFLLTYMDAFRVVGIFFLCCIPLLLLFRRRKGGAAAPAPLH